MTRSYNIAGLTVEMDTWGRTLSQAEPYLSAPGPAQIVLTSHWEEMQKKHPHLSPDDCEYVTTATDFCRSLLAFDGFVLHASAVVMDGYAYLFSAPSGTGKSTHTKLWQEVFGPERARILNDDKPALRLENGVFYAYGTPWSGKYDRSENLRAPVAGICILRRGEENRIAPFGGKQAIFQLLNQTLRPKDPVLGQNLLSLLDRLFQSVGVFEMACNTHPDAARMSYAAMAPKGE